MSNITGDEGSFSSGNTGEQIQQFPEKRQKLLQNQFHASNTIPISSTHSNGSSSQLPPQQQQPVAKKKRSLPGTPDPTAEVLALSPTTLMATNRFVCEICNKGFQRDQNLQLHRRGHNLPWKLKQRTSVEVRKRVYICPEPTCVHHNPSRALGDLTGIKKHYSRKHGEKKWKCDKCSKKYAVQSDWKAHQKTCGTREYKCDCGTIFSRRDSFITHRAFCDALTEENNKVNKNNLQGQMPHDLMSSMPIDSNTNTSMAVSEFNNYEPKNILLKSLPQELIPMPFKPMNISSGMFSSNSGILFDNPKNIHSSSSSLHLSSNGPTSFNYGHQDEAVAHMSATALLQKAAQMGATASSGMNSPMMQKSFVTSMAGPDQNSGSKSPPYGGRVVPDQVQVHQQNGSFDDFQQTDGDNQSTLAVFNMNDMGLYSEMLMGSNQQNHGFIKNMEAQEDSSNSSLIQGRAHVGRSRFGGNCDDMLTVDFLGIGGSRPPNIHEQHQQQQQRFGLQKISQQGMHVMNPFQQHDSDMEKPKWDV